MRTSRVPTDARRARRGSVTVYAPADEAEEPEDPSPFMRRVGAVGEPEDPSPFMRRADAVGEPEDPSPFMREKIRELKLCVTFYAKELKRCVTVYAIWLSSVTVYACFPRRRR